MEKTRMYWCLGNDMPVNIHIRGERYTYVKNGTVTALNPEVIHAGRPQRKGLFLSRAILHRHNIQKVVTKHNGIDVTKHAKMSIGPAL